jgi:hypothetical protein
MRSSRKIPALLAVLALTAAAAYQASAVAPRERDFEFTYRTTITDIPEGAKKVALWIPYPVSDRNQEITDLKITAPYPTSVHKDPLYGNSILYMEVDAPKEKSVSLEMDLRVERKEYVRKDFSAGKAPEGAKGENPMSRWLQPDRLVPLDDFVRKLAAEVTAGKSTDLEKARAIYDYAVKTMTYDKSGTGWGRGDIYYACNIKKGNCTDFHAMFIGLARASGIPAKFAIGFPLPEDKKEGEIGGYHCWAEFYLKGYGWVPVDASEAGKHPEKKEYFFGAHDENRVQFSIGRDVVLNPPQEGDPVNFFVYPYVEIDGKPFAGVEKKFLFKDTPAPAGGSGTGAGAR